MGDTQPAVAVGAGAEPYLAEQVNLTRYSADEGTRRDAIVVRKFDETGTKAAYLVYLGGSGRNVATGLAVDREGNAYLVGHTASPDFPITVGAWKEAPAGLLDAFITKISPNGRFPVYSTYLGGQANDLAFGVAVDLSGNAYVTGYTDSNDFPVTVTGGRERTREGDVFVAKLAPLGGRIAYSTTVGGKSIDTGRGIAIDGAGSAYVTGFTLSDDFPVTPDAVQPKASHGSDAFLFSLNPEGAIQVFSTYLGGEDTDEGTSVAIDEKGKVQVAGFTRSLDFPTTGGSGRQSNSSDSAGFLSVFDPDRTMSRSFYLNGANSEARALVHDPNGRVFVIGSNETPASAATKSGHRSSLHTSGTSFAITADDLGTQFQQSSVNHVENLPSSTPADSGPPSVAYTSRGTNGIDGNYGCPIPLAKNSVPSDCVTALLADPSDKNPLESRTPLILIHGIHGNSINTNCQPSYLFGINFGFFNCTPVDDETGYFSSNYFTQLIANLSPLKSRYKIYTFHYVSNRYSVRWVAKSLRNRVDRLRLDDSSGFGNKPLVIVAHSMGGLVARSFMNEHEEQIGPWAGLKAGESVVKLITLATPHHGTPGANGITLRMRGTLNRLVHFNWANFLDIADGKFWGKNCPSCVSDPSSMNRRDLRSDGYGGIFADVPGLYALNNNERNDDLINMPGTYDQKISAYYGFIGSDALLPDLGNLSAIDLIRGAYSDYLDPDFTDDCVSNSNCTYIHTKAVVAGLLVHRAYYNNWSGTGIGFSLSNDGLVPVQSGMFEGAGVLRRVECSQADHRQMKDGDNTDCRDPVSGERGSLFSMLAAELSGLKVTNPSGILTVTPTSPWNFGPSNIGTPIEKNFQLSNAGATALSVTAINSIIPNSTDFSIVSSPSLPFSIAAKGSQTVRVRFKPGAAGAKNATWTISYTGGSPQSVSISLSGTGVAVAPPACTYTLSPGSVNFPYTGGNNSFKVNTDTGCSWQAISTDTSWLNVTSPQAGSGTSGTGTQTVQFTALANQQNTGKVASIIVNGVGQTQTFFVFIDGRTSSSCSYSLSATSRSYSSDPAANNSFMVATSSSCEWSATSQTPWITVSSAGTKLGTLPVTYNVAVNPFSFSRVGVIQVQGQGVTNTFSITQGGAANTCSYSLDPSQKDAIDGGGTNFFQVVTGAGCNWRASVSDTSWLSIQYGGYGSAGGYVNYTVTQNPSVSPRTGFITIQGDAQTVVHTISQQGQPNVRPTIVLPKTSFNLGNVLIGSPTYQTVTVQNNGSGPLYIRSAFIASGMSEFSAPTALPTIPPQGTAFLTVTLTPTTVGAKSAVMSLTSNDPDTPSVDANLSASAVVPGSGGSDFQWSVKGSAPSSIAGAAVTTIGSNIYVLGGNSGSLTNWRYDPTQGTGTWTQIADSPYGIRQGGAAAIDGKIYMVSPHYNAVQIYDPQSNSWSTGALMPTQRNSFVVAVVNGKLYTLGGSLNLNSMLVRVEEYDPVTNQWSQKADMPTGRANAVAAVVNNVIYVIGGQREDLGPLTTTEAFDPITNSWTTREDMPTRRSVMAVAVLQNKIYVIGGLGRSDPRIIATVEEFDPSKADAPFPDLHNAWAAKNSANTSRSHAVAAMVNSKIYVIGGLNADLANIQSIEEGTLSAAPVFSMQSRAASFGDVPMKNGREIALVIQNPGNATLFLSYTSIPPLSLDQQDFREWTPPGSIEGGGSATLRLRFAPRTLGSKTKTLRISTNDTTAPLVEIILTGNGVAAPVLPLGQSLNVTKTISIPASGTLRGFTVNGGFAYVTTSNPPQLFGIDLASGIAEASATFAPSSATPVYPAILGSRAYVPLSDLGSNAQLAVVDLSTKNVQYIPTISQEPIGTGVWKNWVYVLTTACWTNGDADILQVLDSTTNTFTRTLPTIRVSSGFAVDPETGRGYITGGGCAGSSSAPIVPQILDANTNTIVGSVAATYATQKLSIAGTKAYMFESGFVDVVDISSDKILAQIPVDADAYNIAAAARFVYVGSLGNGIYVIDTATNLIVSFIAMTETNVRLAANPQTNALYVLNGSTKTLTVYEPSQAAFGLSCSSSLAAAPGNTAVGSCALTSQGGYAGSVNLSCGGLPQGASCSFNPAPATVPANGSAQTSLTVTLPAAIVPGIYGFSVTGSDSTITSTARLNLTASTCSYSGP